MKSVRDSKEFKLVREQIEYVRKHDASKALELEGQLNECATRTDAHNQGRAKGGNQVLYQPQYPNHPGE